MYTIALVGRPNAGKSTLFNALLRQRKAIESSVPGTTRDRVFGHLKTDAYHFLLVDTGGLQTEEGTDIEQSVRAQALESIAGADLIYFCIDSREEVTSEEEEVAQLLRRHAKKKTILLVGTKTETPKIEAEALAALWSLRVGDDVCFVAAKQGKGLHELIEKTEELCRQKGYIENRKEELEGEEYVAKIAILGKPNAGKSTLVNVLSGKELSIVSPESGTTRDQIDSVVSYHQKKFLFVDTAGLAKKSTMHREEIERYSRLRALQAIYRSDMALLLIDSSKGISHQDQAIAKEIVEAGKGLVLVFSKWDLLRETDSKEMQEKRNLFLWRAKQKFAFLPWAPTLFLSSEDKRGMHHLFETAEKVAEERRKKIPTRELNALLEQALFQHPPASRGTRQLKVKYAVQTGTEPPAFKFFVNDPELAHFSFARYLENRIREAHGFWGTPMQIHLEKKSKKNPYV